MKCAKQFGALLAWFLLLPVPVFAQDGQQQFANLGDLKLQNGDVLHDCRIGYRTFGKLNDSRSNVILFPTWAGGTTEQLSDAIGPGKLADSSKYFVIAVDALSNGVSSSPSNSTAQPRMHFPQITIHDMAESQHRLLTEKLGIHHGLAVMGISMEGCRLSSGWFPIPASWTKPFRSSVRPVLPHMISSSGKHRLTRWKTTRHGTAETTK